MVCLSLGAGIALMYTIGGAVWRVTLRSARPANPPYGATGASVRAAGGTGRIAWT
jgi:hypothetical protein